MKTLMLHRLLYKSPLGELTIEGTSDHIYSILFNELELPVELSTIEHQHEGQDETSDFPEVMLRCRDQLDEYFRGERFVFDFPIYYTGTPFQQAVWTELATVPYASSRSYKDLAIAVGSEKAVRAVGSANGRNKLSIVLPCHRIVGSNGKLTGYAGGLWRKEWLLQHEALFAPKSPNVQV
ncbi:methylated-DNA--[protein]-cysteine S-methyltransferase [Saccharibacillus sp. JS10]|uniref:methylated-DNA--[protein]-cysteine S-methyltransferase n=1 Tax=Saccharibacillus sp. JS10 TaxID=2950552 RepID=UPI00210D884D|nr:methylated-DNA--[protein]-cysteine S-methyltransferase [Saccharibacillus sp. JS10]MCQ4088274.1 methylated-DNA--[protein]-cysteine S-methyltransferase [Saccharibacillus sp. JS10]